MKPKFYQLTDEEVERVKTLIVNEIKKNDKILNPNWKDQALMSGIYESLTVGAPDMDAKAKECHDLKNRVQALQIELHMLKGKK